MQNDLIHKHCKALEPGTPAFDKKAVALYLNILPGWQVNEDGKKIFCAFKFKNYYETMAFVNAVAFIAHQEDHHPDLEVSYNRCIIHYNTHTVDGISENDFICAAKINALFHI